MKQYFFLFLSLTIGLLACQEKTQEALIYNTDSLQVEQVSANTYRHISYLPTKTFGNVACNGMVVIDNGEALIMDTPTDDESTEQLITWLEDSINCKTVGVVISHFHEDCLGGINAFHKRQIPSYASIKTIEFATKDSLELPQIAFENYTIINVGNKKVEAAFLGEGHTKDNIVCYFPDEKVLFGGCLIKCINANKGYTGDANIDEWSNTVQAVKSKYNKAKVVIPGHGKHGDLALLDYTIELFKVN